MRPQVQVSLIAPPGRKRMNDARDPAEQFRLKERYLIQPFYL